MANETSAGIGLPPVEEASATKSPQVETKTTTAGFLDKLSWLKFWGSKSSPKPSIQDGPIPGVTPATPDQLFGQSGPRVMTESEQADINSQEIKSATKVA